MAIRRFPVIGSFNPINSASSMALNGFMNYIGNSLSAYGQSSTHVSSSGRIHGGRGGTFDGGANGSVLSSLTDPLIGSNQEVNQTFSVPSSAPAVYQAPLKPQTLDYLNAELASAYGMSRSTAYQEALANTSYQRAVKDMKAAGLNPAVLFGAGRGSAANSSIYASENSGSARSSGYGRSSSAKGQLFSSSAYSALSAIGGLVGIALTGKPDGFWIGSQTTQGAMGLLNAASSLANK